MDYAISPIHLYPAVLLFHLFILLLLHLHQIPALNPGTSAENIEGTRQQLLDYEQELGAGAG